MPQDKMMKQWTIEQRDGKLDSLKLNEVPVPKPGPGQVLLQVKALSLNYRDHVILHDAYGFPIKDGVVPISDGAGEIVEVGQGVTKWKAGDRVMAIFSQGHQDGLVTDEDGGTSLGGGIDGMAQQFIALPQEGVVRIPKNYSFAQAASLPCAAVTAWNSLYGLDGRQLMAGQTVVTQGTGGVSLFGVQFAKAAGARVVATTSSAEKEAMLKKMGADHVVNYKTTPEWGSEVKKLVPGGAHHIIEVGGPGTLEQSLAAIRREGVISMIGFVAGGGKTPDLLQTLLKTCIVRGIWIGSRRQAEQVVDAIDINGIEPTIDETTFKFEDLPKAYEHLANARHVGKIVVNVD